MSEEKKSPTPEEEGKRKEEGKKGKGGTKGGKRRRKGHQGSGKRDGDRGNPTGNHISWYTPSPELLNQVGAIPFGDPIGMETPNAQYSAPIPGIAVMEWAPCYAMGTRAQQDLKIATNKIWADVRAKNSRTATYQPADLMLYFLAMDNVYILYTMAVRAYGVIRHYDVLNRYLAKTLVEACGFDYDSLIADLNGFRYLINMIAMRLNHIPIPSNLPLISKHAWMSNNVWRETDSPKSQMYLFRPSHLYKFSATASETGGSLQPINLVDYMGTVEEPAVGMNIDQFADLVTELVEPIAYDDDFTAMAGDILKAYDSGSYFYMEEIPEGYVVNISAISKDTDAYEVIVGFHNADIVPFDYIGSVSQRDGNYLTQAFRIEYEYDENHSTGYQNNKAYINSAFGYHLTHRRWLDIIRPEPTPANIMYATRYMVGKTTLFENSIDDIDCGTEVITGLLIYNRAERINRLLLNWDTYHCNYVDAFDNPANLGSGPDEVQIISLQTNIEQVVRTTAFKYLPHLGFVNVDMYDGVNPAFANTATPTRVWSIEYATTTDGEAISKLHSVARLSEFGINVFKSGTAIK